MIIVPIWDTEQGRPTGLTFPPPPRPDAMRREERRQDITASLIVLGISVMSIMLGILALL